MTRYYIPDAFFFIQRVHEDSLNKLSETGSNARLFASSRNPDPCSEDWVRKKKDIADSQRKFLLNGSVGTHSFLKGLAKIIAMTS